ncbi:hypothetical protein AYI70_g6557 [Smittium culicis]|uniref:Uncharacterized protein n=1 Tax=Smittium culicis TaxID=133412 RepID=A0A1R1XPD8_9FUNG|nr:hypothetical protein AYI70_g6557 [Smittium culicis]
MESLTSTIRMIHRNNYLSSTNLANPLYTSLERGHSVVLALLMERESKSVQGTTIWNFPITTGFYQNLPSIPRYEDQNQVHDAAGTRKQDPGPPKNSKLNDKSGTATIRAIA